MSIALDDLISDLESEVPAVKNVPTSEQYERAVKDAVADFSRRCGKTLRDTLNIVAGTATYDLAEDFLKMVALGALAGQGGVGHSASGQLIAIPADFCEDHVIDNKQITFYPTPTYNMAREYKYKAAWITTVDDYGEVYERMGEDEAQIVLLKAKSICLGKQANAESAGMKYSLGAVSVDKGSSVEVKNSKANKLNEEFEEACKAYNGAVGMA